MKRRVAKPLGAALLSVAISATVLGASRQDLPAKFAGVGIEQHMNAQVPLNTLFHDESGAALPLGSFFTGKPVLLVPVYYRCPMLCSQVLHGVVAGLRPLRLTPGRDFEVLAISFDPRDTSNEAAQKRDDCARSYSRRAGVAGWHFLVGPEQSIQSVMNAIGFKYRWDPASQTYIHASGGVILTPDGRVARYLYGVEYEPKDLKQSLIEASRGRIGSAAEKILLFCFRYDPASGRYGALVINLLRSGAVLTVLAIGVAMFFLWRRDLRDHRV